MIIVKVELNQFDLLVRLTWFLTRFMIDRNGKWGQEYASGVASKQLPCTWALVRFNTVRRINLCSISQKRLPVTRLIKILLATRIQVVLEFKYGLKQIGRSSFKRMLSDCTFWKYHMTVLHSIFTGTNFRTLFQLQLNAKYQTGATH